MTLKTMKKASSYKKEAHHPRLLLTHLLVQATLRHQQAKVVHGVLVRLFSSKLLRDRYTSEGRQSVNFIPSFLKSFPKSSYNQTSICINYVLLGCGILASSSFLKFCDQTNSLWSLRSMLFLCLACSPYLSIWHASSTCTAFTVTIHPSEAIPALWLISWHLISSTTRSSPKPNQETWLCVCICTYTTESSFENWW